MNCAWPRPARGLRARTGTLTVAGAILALACNPALAPSATPPAAAPGSARLQGQFLLAGRITVATNVRGEHVGQKMMRTWTFMPACPAGACPTIGLVRRRVGGSDQLVLRRLKPGYYTGTGSFFAALRCGSHAYRMGSAVPFAITVRVTSAVLAGGAVLATRVNATYTNRSRSNLTPCVGVLGHDAATYHGHIDLPAPPSGGAGT